MGDVALLASRPIWCLNLITCRTMFVFRPAPMVMFDSDGFGLIIVYGCGIEAHAKFQSSNKLTEKYLV